MSFLNKRFPWLTFSAHKTDLVAETGDADLCVWEKTKLVFLFTLDSSSHSIANFEPPIAHDA